MLLAWKPSRTKFCVLGELHSEEGRKAAKLRAEAVLDGTGEWVQVDAAAGTGYSGGGGGAGAGAVAEGEVEDGVPLQGWPPLV